MSEKHSENKAFKMIKKFTKYCTTATLTFVIGAGCVLLYPFNASRVSKQDVTIEVQYMQRTCENRCIQTKVVRAEDTDGILRSKSRDEEDNYYPIRFIGWNVPVFVKGDSHALSRYLDKVASADPSGNCIHPVFRLTGQFRIRPVYALLYHDRHYDGTYFDASRAEVVKDLNPACKKMPDIPL